MRKRLFEFLSNWIYRHENAVAWDDPHADGAYVDIGKYVMLSVEESFVVDSGIIEFMIHTDWMVFVIGLTDGKDRVYGPPFSIDLRRPCGYNK